MSGHVYRPDIDGLRAIAVFSVVIFHAFPSYLHAGFIGVDIFFVISGYLISQGIFKNQDSSSFSLLSFYERRIRRIFPALITVLFFTFLMGLVFYIPVEFASLGRHVVAGAAFYSNIQLWLEIDYFDQSSNLKPLLHLWSLGVEEQFYIIWPLFIAFFYKGRFFLKTLVSFVLLSFLACLYVSYTDATTAFYIPLTRFWELAVGAFVAFVERKEFSGRLYYLVQKYSSLLGLVTMLFAFIYIDEKDVFPGWVSLLPVAGTALLIFGGMSNSINSVVVGNRLSVFFGVISYPMYLWHWPLLVFGRVLEGGTPSFRIRVALVASTIILAYLTYKWVEVPFRFGRAKKHAPKLLIGGMMSMAALGFVAQTGAISSFMPIVQRVNSNFIEALSDREFPGKLKQEKYNDSYVYVKGNEARTAFIGDSHIQQYYSMIENVGTLNGYVFITEGGCPPIVIEETLALPECKSFYDNVELFLNSNQSIKNIVIAACWNCYFAYSGKDGRNDGKIRFHEIGISDKALHSFVDYIKLLSERYNVTVLGDNPMDDRFDPRFYIGSSGKRYDILFGDGIIQTVSPTESFQVSESQLQLDREFRELFTRSNVHFVSMIDLVCPRAECHPLVGDGRPIYTDNNHMRPFYVKTLFGAELKQLIK
jgi:peptidoglycan/LPS O-acetylase OafA/YrhL